jgi:hypothetical protein
VLTPFTAEMHGARPGRPLGFGLASVWSCRRWPNHGTGRPRRRGFFSPAAVGRRRQVAAQVDAALDMDHDSGGRSRTRGLGRIWILHRHTFPPWPLTCQGSGWWCRRMTRQGPTSTAIWAGFLDDGGFRVVVLLARVGMRRLPATLIALVVPIGATACASRPRARQRGRRSLALSPAWQRPWMPRFPALTRSTIQLRSNFPRAVTGSASTVAIWSPRRTNDPTMGTPQPPISLAQWR